MGTNRLEAFSDGVIAVIITIMVLELKAPEQPTRQALLALLPMFLIYALSFLAVAIMWVNHHHLLQMARRADGALLWANNNLLFWMSLVPLVTAYLGRNHAAPLAVAVYGSVMTCIAISFQLLPTALLRHQEYGSRAHRRLSRYRNKGMLSMALYAAAVPLAFVSVPVSIGIFVTIPLTYFLPDWGGEAAADATTAPAR